MTFDNLGLYLTEFSNQDNTLPMNVQSHSIYRIVAILSLLCLVIVQFQLIYNTFELENNQYYLKEKDIIHENYSALIRNDKLYPGAQKIIDSHIIPNMDLYKKLYFSDRTAYERRLAEDWRKMIHELRLHQNMDSIFPAIVRQFNLNKELKYGLYIEHLSLSFDGRHYVPIFRPNVPGIQPYHPNGDIIAGTLERTDKQNSVSVYTVSAYTPNSYQITFALYVDQDNRTLQIFKAMLPTFLLAIFSILMVVGIYFITYRNWMRQKKLTAMTSDFINSISHEFNTPIATILVANQSLKDTISNSENIKALDLIAVIKRQTIRLKKLINQSLMISQLSRINLDKRKYYLPSVLMEILEDYSLKLDANVSIIPEIEGDINDIEMNKVLFTTMIYNLLDNGIKYNLSDKKIINIRVYPKEGNIHLEIQDNGVGIDLKSLKHIFKKFFRGKQRVEEGGLGLGLFYVQQVVNLHGWELAVESVIDKGTKFTIKINGKR